MPDLSLPVQMQPPPLVESDDGSIRIAGTRIPLERVVRAFLAGAQPEQIVMDYDVLKLEDVYAVIDYFLHHRPEVESYLASREQAARAIRSQIESLCDPAGIRERLLARRNPTR